MTKILNTTTLTFLQETTFIFYTIAFGWIMWYNSQEYINTPIDGCQPQYIEWASLHRNIHLQGGATVTEIPIPNHELRNDIR